MGSGQRIAVTQTSTHRAPPRMGTYITMLRNTHEICGKRCAYHGTQHIFVMLTETCRAHGRRQLRQVRYDCSDNHIQPHVSETVSCSGSLTRSGNLGSDISRSGGDNIGIYKFGDDGTGRGLGGTRELGEGSVIHLLVLRHDI